MMTFTYFISALVSIPYFFVLVAGMARIWILSKRSSLSTEFTHNWLYFIKMTTLLLLFLTTVSSFAYSVFQVGIEWIDNVQILSEAVSVVMMVSGKR
jgi:hypothetical protein